MTISAALLHILLLCIEWLFYIKIFFFRISISSSFAVLPSNSRVCATIKPIGSHASSFRTARTHITKRIQNNIFVELWRADSRTRVRVRMLCLPFIWYIFFVMWWLSSTSVVLAQSELCHSAGCYLHSSWSRRHNEIIKWCCTVSMHLKGTPDCNRKEAINVEQATEHEHARNWRPVLRFDHLRKWKVLLGGSSAFDAEQLRACKFGIMLDGWLGELNERTAKVTAHCKRIHCVIQKILWYR